MSTPITHNQIFTSAVMEALKQKRPGASNALLSEFAMEVVKAGVGYHNYPDAVQAVRREDGSILSRRVTHFENSKLIQNSCNSHEIFTPSFLANVNETVTVSGAHYHDTMDQQGDVIGQLTDFAVFRQAIRQYKNKVTEDVVKAYCLADLYAMHIEIADFFNDMWFREYVKCLPNGDIVIGNTKFAEEEKKEAFAPFKSVLMKLQENASAKYLAKYKLDLHELNEAIETSYKESYSEWLATNTLKYVKKITLEPVEITVEERDFLKTVGLNIDILTEEAEEFVNKTTLLTSAKLIKLIPELIAERMISQW